MSHTFHIPVLGLGFTVDTPLKVGRYGISSVISIVDDMLIERMRKFYAKKHEEEYVAIDIKDEDHRAKRICDYLNMVNRKLNEQFEQLKSQLFTAESDLTRYFQLLPETSFLKIKYNQMLVEADQVEKDRIGAALRQEMNKGAIDVNIMAKIDKTNFRANGENTGEDNSDALAGLRGFAMSDLDSSIVLSAGMNPRLYGYLESFPDFFPDQTEKLKKKVILKVSDFRSAFIQAKFLAKKGIWVSEFRVESGLNCGGHAFATEGYLIGPILEEFKTKRQDMIVDIFAIYQNALLTKGITISNPPAMRITVQGGIGTVEENNFILDYYQVDGTGWGSPFLLVAEATNVDAETLENLTKSTAADFYISGSSPLGVPFNNYRLSSAEKQRVARIEKGRPGSPCKKKYLVSNTEFTALPICLASREYQNLKLKQLDTLGLAPDDYQTQYTKITEKLCLCEGLSAATYIKDGILNPKEEPAVAICPGPNLAYFSRAFSLDEMVKHIYGKINLLQGVTRSSFFVNELNLYVDYLKNDISNHLKTLDAKKIKQLEKFKEQLLIGIEYYKKLAGSITNQTEQYLNKFIQELQEIEVQLKMIAIQEYSEV
ncbi:hypothetical protein ADIARSV_1657 [Arcticibacter svalbardensis MN12-7]|uniref:Uncharacterized protein n=1 Tax=Arcticibacter svalbardensis MN12-7 TaxID=1150600 RepID=R9H1W0_9SPHI|nr:hypothetical protein [Arcticibacter svalbardensis]EOR95169.1 hypothetical protein ADIARSV_1657 [Arcticibacter svalbardensis MN12-7]